MSTEAPPRVGNAPLDDRSERRGLRPASTEAVVRLGVGVVALGLLAHGLGGISSGLMLAGLVVAFAGACYLAVFTAPSWMVALGLAASVFSGNSGHLGLPIGPDRLLIAAGLGALVMGMPGVSRERTIAWRPLHAVLAAAAAIGTISAFAAGTLQTAEGFFGLLDRLGLVPFLVFAIAPLVFGTDRDRNALLVVLVGTGAYLGITAVLEGTGNAAWVLPRFITDPSLGIHFGRARGPFLESVGNGMALYGCAVAAAVAVATWRTPRSRWFAATVCVLCLGGTIFTLTRAVWLATVVASVMALLVSARTRSYVVPIASVGTGILVLALTFVPGFANAVAERSGDQRPLWDRFNTNRAAVEMIRERPLTGVGWSTFELHAPDYMEVSPDYPLTGVGIPVHNVPLSHAAELGVLGAGLWLLGLVLAVGAGTLRPGPESLDPWRLGLLALFLHWLIVASFGPLGYAFPNLLLWTWAGTAALGHISRPLTPEERWEWEPAPTGEPS